MPSPWTDTVKQRRRLSVYAGPSLDGGQWTVVLEQALRDFNGLSRQHGLGVTLSRSSDAPRETGGADVSVETAREQISFTYDGGSHSTAFSGDRMHGRTFQISRDGRIEKAFVFLPSGPRVNTPNGMRPVGAGVMRVILVHELVHACGLTNSEHTTDDLFQANPQVDPGDTEAGDRVRIQSRRGSSSMPPLVLSGSTTRHIRALWR